MIKIEATSTYGDFKQRLEKGRRAHLVRRIRNADYIVRQMSANSREAICAASSIAFTHPSAINTNWDFSGPIVASQFEKVALEVGRKYRQEVSRVYFGLSVVVTEEFLFNFLNGMWAALVAVVSGRSGHAMGIVPGGRPGELGVWDTSSLPYFKPVDTGRLADKLSNTGENLGLVLKFNRKRNNSTA